MVSVLLNIASMNNIGLCQMGVTRRAPSIIIADLPLRLSFHRINWSYIFLFITESKFDYT